MYNHSSRPPCLGFVRKTLNSKVGRCYLYRFTETSCANISAIHFCDRLDEIVKACGRKPNKAPQLHDDWSSVASYSYEDNHVVCACSGDWSILCGDYELLATLFSDKELCKSLAKAYGVRIVTAYGDDTNCAYGFSLHSTSSSRAVLVAEGMHENYGDPIPGEPPVDKETYNSEDVLRVLDLLGIDIEEGLESTKKSSWVKFKK